MTEAVHSPIGARSNGLARSAISVVVGAVVGALGCLAVASIARAGGVSDGFSPLHATSYIPLVIIAAIIGAIGWNIVSRRSADPRRTLSRLVPAVVIISFVPDVLVGIGDSMPHTTWGAVATLMIMHLVVAVALVGSYARFLAG